MNQLANLPEASQIHSSDIWSLTDGGERVTHLFPNDCYFAHLSIYQFAASYCQNALVLDAGCGTGFGAAYLADHGARKVIGIDLSEKAIGFDSSYFQKPNLDFQVLDLQKVSRLGRPIWKQNSFDIVFSSNTLEHIPDVAGFLRDVCHLLRPSGQMILAVPPLTGTVDWEENLKNPFHLNIWSPRQWFQVFQQYFGDVQPYWHGFEKTGITLDFYNTPDETIIDENDFLFKPVSINQFYDEPALTVILVGSLPRSGKDLPKRRQDIIFIENSISRPKSALHTEEADRERKWVEWKRKLDRARTIAREEGILALIRSFWHYLRNAVEADSNG